MFAANRNALTFYHRACRKLDEECRVALQSVGYRPVRGYTLLLLEPM